MKNDTSSFSLSGSNTLFASSIPVPQDESLRREWVKYQLRVRGISMASLARANAASRQVVALTLVRSNPRWESVIAQALGMPPSKIWPERYDPTSKMPVSASRRLERETA